MSNMLMLLYLLSDGNTEDNLAHIFNLFDGNGDKTISIDELLNVMTFFIEIDEGKNHKVGEVILIIFSWEPDL